MEPYHLGTIRSIPTSTIRPSYSHCQFSIRVADITPPVGIYHRMWGAARHDQATGVDRPLRATVAALQGRDRRTSPHPLLLIALDHCIVGRDELAAIHAAVWEVAAVPADRLHVVCSHTHAAGFINLDRTAFPGGGLIPGYLLAMSRTIGGLVAEVLDSIEDAVICYAYGQCDLAIQRDQWDADADRYVCGYTPDTAADDTVLCAAVHDESGRALATIVNYACHPTTLAWDNTLISPDFPGALREVVEQQTTCPCLFLQGASGDLGPRQGFVGEIAIAERNGRQLGFAALSILEGMLPPNTNYVYQGIVESGTAIGTWGTTPIDGADVRRAARWGQWAGDIPLPYRADLPQPEEIEARLSHLLEQEADARACGDDTRATLQRAMAERQRRELSRRLTHPAGPTFPWKVAVWRIGDALWICVQGEPYSQLQVELRQRFPRHPILVAAVGYDWGLGYLPTRDRYGKNLYQQNIAIVEPGSLENGIDEISRKIELLFESSI